MTPLVRIRLGSDWEEHKAGAVVTVDARRGAWVIENVEASAPADKMSAEHLGVDWHESEAPKRKATKEGKG